MTPSNPKNCVGLHSNLYMYNFKITLLHSRLLVTCDGRTEWCSCRRWIYNPFIRYYYYALLYITNAPCITASEQRSKLKYCSITLQVWQLITRNWSISRALVQFCSQELCNQCHPHRSILTSMTYLTSILPHAYGEGMCFLNATIWGYSR